MTTAQCSFLTALLQERNRGVERMQIEVVQDNARAPHPKHKTSCRNQHLPATLNPLTRWESCDCEVMERVRNGIQAPRRRLSEVMEPLRNGTQAPRRGLSDDIQNEEISSPIVHELEKLHTVSCANKNCSWQLRDEQVEAAAKDQGEDNISLPTTSQATTTDKDGDDGMDLVTRLRDEIASLKSDLDDALRDTAAAMETAPTGNGDWRWHH